MIKGFIEYNTYIFTTEMIARLKDNFIQLLLAMDIDPDLTICQASFASEKDLKFIGEWNKTEAPYENDL